MSYPVFYPFVDDTLYIPFDTYDGGTGASITMSGLAVSDIEIYKDGSVTQRSSDAGYTLLDTDGIDFDGITGLHGFSIDLSDNTDAGFYAAGSMYWVVVSSITVDSQTVTFLAAVFTILPTVRGFAGTALPAAAADAAGGIPISDAGGLDLDTQLAATNEVTAARMGALTDWVNGGRLDLILDIIAADVVNIDGAAMRGTDNAALASVVGALADAAAAGDPTSADTLMQYMKQLINVLVGTAGIATWPASAAPGNAISLAEALRAVYDDSNELQGDWVNAGRLDTILDAAATAAALSTAQTDLTNIVADTNELQQDWADGGRLDLIQDIIAADVVNIDGAAMRGTDNAALASVVGALADAAAAGDPTSADTLMQYLKQLVNVLVGTAGIGAWPAEAAPANAVNIAEALRAVHADTNALPDSGALTTIGTDTARLTAARAQAIDDWINGGRLDLLLDAIKAVTDALPDAGALTTIGTDTARLTAVRAAVLTDWIDAGRLDLLLDAIKAVTDALPNAGALTTLQADTDDIQARLPAALVGGRMDSNMSAINNVNAAAVRLALTAGQMVSGAAEAGTLSLTQMTSDLTEATDDHYIGRTVLWTSGLLIGQASDITDYTGATGMLTYTTVTDVPSAADTFIIV